MDWKELMDSVDSDSVDLVELLRRCLVFASDNRAAFEEGHQDSAIVGQASLLERDVVRVLRGSSLLPPISLRVQVQQAVQSRLAVGDLRSMTVLAHGLAMGLEEAISTRLYRHLAAKGPASLDKNDLLPVVSPLHTHGSSLLATYRSTGLLADPAKLSIDPAAVRRRARLRPDMPHATTLRWLPNLMPLDELGPDSLVATVVLGGLDEMHWDASKTHFSNVRPKDPQARTRTALELVAAADAAGASIVLLPEVSLDPTGVDAVAEWVETNAKNILLAVCGSTHRCVNDHWQNSTVLTTSRPKRESVRIEQRKIRPFVYESLAEDILAPGGEIVLITTAEWSVVTLICIDFLDLDLCRLACDLKPSFVLVPATSEKTDEFANLATSLVTRTQGHVLISNQIATTTHAPFGSYLRRPVRGPDAQAVAAAAPAPAVFLATLAAGPFRKISDR